jgi:hypothetical protein
MSYNGSGTFNINTAGQPVVTGTTITSTAFNLLTADLATGLSTALTKDGQTTPTANIPMGSFKLTGLGAGTAATDAAQYGQLQAGATTIATVTGTDTYVGTLSPAIAAYATGNLFSFVAPNTNTGAATINLNSLGAKSITKLGSTALAAGDIVSGRVYQIEYDGTRFQLLNPSASSVASFSAGSTGFTPSSATTGAVTLAGTLATTNGGTGLTSFTANGVVYASSSSALATGSALTFDGTALTSLNNSTAQSIILSRTSATARNWALGIDGDGGFRLTDATGSNVMLSIIPSGVAYLASASELLFKYNTSVEGMRLTSNGLGIGTSSPSYKLDVSTSSEVVGRFARSAGSDALLLIQDSTTTTAPYIASYGNAMAFGTYGGTEFARFSSTGNLGLGVTPSGWVTFKAVELTGGAIAGINTNQLDVVQNAYYDGAFKYKTTYGATYYQQTNSTHSWYNAPSGTAGNAITFTQAMTLDASGRLGLGATSMDSLFVVNSTGETAIQYRVSGTPKAYVGVTSASAQIIDTSAAGDYCVRSQANILFSTGGQTERARIDSSGNMGIGNSSPPTGVRVTSRAPSASGYNLFLEQNNGSDGYLLACTSTDGALTFSRRDTSGTNTSEKMRIDSSGNLLVGTTSQLQSSRFSVLGTGNIGDFRTSSASGYPVVCENTATGSTNMVVFLSGPSTTTVGSITYNSTTGLTVYATTSDYRAKDIYGPVTDSGALIDSVPVYMGMMKGATQERPMFIAHETPSYAHTGEKDAVDADGNPVYQQMDASALIPVMWAEIQSLRKRLADAGI